MECLRAVVGGSGTPSATLVGASGAAYRTPVALEPGLAARLVITVTEADTAIAAGSGDVPVLATPRVIALCEKASLQAVGAHLSPGETTVGTRVQLDHLAPTAVDHEVTVDATLERIEGRRLLFKVSVSDGRGLVAAGKVTRAVVERRRFLEKAH